MSMEPDLQKARELVGRWDSKNSYPFVAEKVLQKEYEDVIQEISETDIINLCGGVESAGLTMADIIVRVCKINMGMKDKNPIDFVRFYTVNEQGSYAMVNN